MKRGRTSGLFPGMLLLGTLVMGGCVIYPRWTPELREAQNEMIAKGESMAYYPSPAIAGVLSILPGGGNFYNGQIGIGIVNTLLWPLSIVWGIPTSVSSASNIRAYRSAQASLYKKRLPQNQDPAASPAQQQPQQPPQQPAQKGEGEKSGTGEWEGWK